MTQLPTTRRGPVTVDGLLADRQLFWTKFTRLVVYAAIALTMLLAAMAIFLV